MPDITVVLRVKKRPDQSEIESVKGKLFLNDQGNDLWIPKSQIKNIEILDNQTMGVTIPDWLAKKYHLI